MKSRDSVPHCRRICPQRSSAPASGNDSLPLEISNPRSAGDDRRTRRRNKRRVSSRAFAEATNSSESCDHVGKRDGCGGGMPSIPTALYVVAARASAPSRKLGPLDPRCPDWSGLNRPRCQRRPSHVAATRASIALDVRAHPGLPRCSMVEARNGVGALRRPSFRAPVLFRSVLDGQSLEANENPCR
jgi:hypothetical protein